MTETSSGMVPGAPYIAERHIVAELNLRIVSRGESVLGRAEVTRELCLPGTDVVRTSVLATWADVLAGGATGDAIAPRIPLTLDLEVQVETPIRIGTTVDVESRATKVGRTVIVTTTEFRDSSSGQRLAVAVATFVPPADPAAVFPDGMPLPELGDRLTVPVAERIGATVLGPGAAEIPRRLDGLNAIGAIQGGLLSIVAEEAARSRSAHPVLVDSLAVRYLRPFMQGPARAVATGATEGVSLVEVTDVGTGKLGVLATARTSPLPATDPHPHPHPHQI